MADTFISRKRKRTNYIQFKRSYASRLPRSIKGNDVKLTCETFLPVYWVNGQALYSLATTGTPLPTSVNVAAIITQSPSYIKYGNLYSKMKIRGYQLSCSSSRGLNSNALTDYMIGFYPNLKGQASSTDVIGHDMAYHVPVTMDRIYKFNQYFSKSTYLGPDGTGYGVWFNPAKVSSLDGQFSIQAVLTIPNSPGTVTLGFIRFRFFLLLSDPVF